MRDKYSAKLNFLSHYYFNRLERSPGLTLGAILPDLIKNSDKTARLFPEKLDAQLWSNPELAAIKSGWDQHMAVDRIFHNLPFFHTHTHALRLLLVPVVQHTPIRASFLSHISLELLLDHLVLSEGLVRAQNFYEDLSKVSRADVQTFLKAANYEQIPSFMAFYDHFLTVQYVGMYSDLAEVSRALINICRRVWKFQFDPTQLEALEQVLAEYKERLLPIFRPVFKEIDAQV